MCGTCGCGEGAVRVELLGNADGHGHADRHGHDGHGHDGHGHGQGAGPHEHREQGGALVEIEQAVLAKNDALAGENRAWLAGRGVLALNMMSSPGAGKTSLLCRTIADIGGRRPVAVVEGDQETRLDAERIRAAGAEVVQINTGSGCHLDAAMLAAGLRRLDPADGTLVFVENVGNLVCPALFDLGEAAKVVVVSVTEGEDKPLKYPQMFAVADLVVVNKVDLLPYVDIELDRLVENCRAVRPNVPVLPTSVTAGIGLDAWYGWLLRPQLDTPLV